MKANCIFVAHITSLIAALFSVTSQGAQEPYQSDNPYFRKASPTPAASAAATSAKAATISSRDKNFLTNATSSGGWEVKTGAVAEKKAESAAVKNLAARLVSDHTKANSELIELAKKKGLQISIDNIKAQQINGPNFDKSYLTLLEQDHQESIALFQKEATSGNDPEIKAYAAKMLPTLRQHSALVKEAQSKTK